MKSTSMSGVTKQTVVECVTNSIFNVEHAGLPKEGNAKVFWKERAGRRLFAAPNMLKRILYFVARISSQASVVVI